MPTFTPRPRAARHRHRDLVDIDLDPVQRRAAERPPGGALLVLGEAGHGKTAVALHRLSYLYKQATGRFRAVVIVPHAGLEHLLQPLVTRLGADVSVQAYERWARAQAHRVFGDIPYRQSGAVPSGVARIKRERRLHVLLRELAPEPPGRIDDDHDAPPPRTMAHAHFGDLQHLFGDGERMRRLARAAGIGPSAVAEILEHTRVQFLLRSEDAYAHVDRDRLRTLDAQALDAGTPMENAASIDVEDYAVLFELDRLRARHMGVRPSRPRRYDCIILDEAQEFAPLELALIGRSLAKDATLVVAGDADQQTDAAAGFQGWDRTMRLLRAAQYETATLEIGYRCPPQVTAFARAVRTAGAVPSGVPCLRFAHEAALSTWLETEIAAIDALDARASFCVVVRNRGLARRLSDALRGKVFCKLVLDGEFVFHRGADITTLENVKGLEFDYVVGADVSEQEYPASPQARRALYVCATRARHQLALACVGAPTPLLPAGYFAAA